MSFVVNLNEYRYEMLSDAARKTLWDWWEGPKKGLWVWGERCSGSSYIGKVALRRALREYGSAEWDYYTALQLMDLIRASWTSAGRDEDELSDEFVTPAEKLEYVFDECKVLMVDDFHDDAVDPKLWRKHVQPRLEASVKDGRMVVVATNLAPAARELNGLERVIESRFVVCDAGR